MEEKQGGSSCGKACGWTCVGCVILMILFVGVPLIAFSCFGCAACAGALPMLSGIFQGVGNASKIGNYFNDLEDQGWEVDSSQSEQPQGYGASIDSEKPMIWRARESEDDEWITYVWTFGTDPAVIERLGESEEPNWSDFGALFNFQLIPRTEAALEVHEELGLPLPDDFELVPWDEEDGGRPERTRDRDRDDTEDMEDEDMGNEDETSGDDEEATDDEDEGSRTRRSKDGGLRKAA